eukprot:scaffold98005_cov60-Phaeocystis_antarctica.AAC.2
MAAHCGPISLSAFGARVGPSRISAGPLQEVMRQPGAHVLAAGVPPMQTLPLAGTTLCGNPPPRGLGRSAFQHTPSALDHTRGSLQPRPASASLGQPRPASASLGQPRPIGRDVLAGRSHQPCSPPRHHAHADRRQHRDARPGGDAHGAAICALRLGAAARVAPRARPRAARASRRDVGRLDHSRLDVCHRRGVAPTARRRRRCVVRGVHLPRLEGCATGAGRRVTACSDGRAR